MRGSDPDFPRKYPKSYNSHDSILLKKIFIVYEEEKI